VDAKANESFASSDQRSSHRLDLVRFARSLICNPSCSNWHGAHRQRQALGAGKPDLHSEQEAIGGPSLGLRADPSLPRRGDTSLSDSPTGWLCFCKQVCVSFVGEQSVIAQHRFPRPVIRIECC